MVSIHEFHAFYCKHVGKSAYFCAAQGCEHHIGVAKLFAKQRGTGKKDMAKQIGNHLDMTGTASIKNNQVNLQKILELLNKEKLYIFDKDITPQIEKILENMMPDVVKRMIAIFRATKPGTQEHPAMIKIFSGLNTDELAQNVRESYQSTEQDPMNEDLDDSSIVRKKQTLYTKLSLVASKQ